MPARDRGDLVRHDLAAGDVVEQEQRLGAAGHQVVDDHRDQVDADRVVDVHLLRDDQLGADAVGRGGEQRLLVLVHVEPEQPGEAADVADHLGPPGAVHLGLEQLDRLLAGVDGDPRVGVGHGAPVLRARRPGRPRSPFAARSCASGPVTCVTVLPLLWWDARCATWSVHRYYGRRSAPVSRPARRWPRRRASGRSGVDPPLDPLEDVLADQVVGRQRDRVLAVEAGPAQPGLRLLGRGDQARPARRSRASRRRSSGGCPRRRARWRCSSARVAKSMP